MCLRASSFPLLQVNVILDTKARREFPSSLTHAEIKIEGDKDIKWLVAQVQREFGNVVPIIGVRYDLLRTPAVRFFFFFLQVAPPILTSKTATSSTPRFFHSPPSVRDWI